MNNNNKNIKKTLIDNWSTEPNPPFLIEKDHDGEPIVNGKRIDNFPVLVEQIKMCIDHQGKDKELVVNGKTVHISNQQLEEEYFQIDEEITDEKLLRYRDFMFETAREQFGPKEEKRLRRIYEQMGLARFRKVVERSVGISSAVHDQLNKKIN